MLRAFEALSPVEQQHVAAEIIRRSTASDELGEDELHHLADELFRQYDAEEAARDNA